MSRKRPALNPDYLHALGVEAPAPAAPRARQAAPAAPAAPTLAKVTVALPAPLVADVRAAVAALPREVTFAGLVADALRRELARLEKQHGPFPAAAAPLRPGRPLRR